MAVIKPFTTMPSPELFLDKRIVIAITGHSDLLAEDKPLLKACLKERLARIAGKQELKILLSALAPGADQLAAEAAREMGIDVCVLLPMAEAEYQISSFDTDDEAFWQLRGWINKNPHVYRLNNESFNRQDKHTAHKNRQRLLEEHAVKIASWADHLIALWDGNDNGKLAGTAHIVRMARNGLDAHENPLTRLNADNPYAGRLHHLLIRRKSNPFPVAPLGDTTADTAQLSQIWPKGTKSATEDLWYNKPFGTDGTWQTFLLPRYSPQLSRQLGVTRFLNAYHEPIIRYAVPAIFFLLTMFVGGMGYLSLSGKDGLVWPGDALAKGADLADPTTAIELTNPNWLILVGRLLGMVTFLYSIAVNVFFLFGDLGIRKFIQVFWTTKKFQITLNRVQSRGFNIICGLTEASFNLFLDLQSKGERVLFLDADADKSPYKSDCINRGAIVLAKDPVSERVLTQFLVWQAKRLFAMTSSETNNLRIVQQAYKLQDIYPSRSKVEWFAQASEVRIRDLLFESLQATKHQNVTVNSFDVFTNIARRHLQDYPLDRFHLAPNRLKTTRLIMVGFGPLAQKIILQALQTGLYDLRRRLFIRIYTPDAVSAKQKFLARYPVLNDVNQDKRIDPIRNELLFMEPETSYVVEDYLCFEDQDKLLADLMYGGKLLLRDVADDSSTNLYVCQEDGVQSVALLRELLPRLMAGLHNEQGLRRDIQAFAFYNFPNRNEEFLVEAHINRDFPDIPITFFGNFLEACTETAICRNAIDNLPELIHWHYGTNFDRNWTNPNPQQTNRREDLIQLKDSLTRQWRAANESNRESSRLAADHLWVKYRLALAWFRQQNLDPYQAQQAMTNWSNQVEDQINEEILNQQKHGGLRVTVAWDKVPPVNELANVEHRRWSLEKLLAGFRPLLWPADYQDQISLTHLVEQWNSNGNFKKHYRKQKIHLDLVPTSVLNKYITGGQSFQHQEKYKDVQQVRGITLFLRKLDDLEWLSVHP